MSKVSGVYASLSRGVSQQPMEARLDGQHAEQVNMWSDPVHGLSRRRGTFLQGSGANNVFGPSYFQLDPAQQKELREFYAGYRSVTWKDQGEEFVVHYPSKPCPAWMQNPFAGADGGIRVTKKIQGSSDVQPGASIMDVFTRADGSPEPTTVARINKGFTAACQVGRYMLLYPNNTPFTHPPEVDGLTDRPNIVIEIRQGIPNRTYTLYLTAGTTYKKFEYTTPSSAYSGTLDTSDIPTSDPDYTKKVNDRVNAYNSAVTAWITEAALKTRPAYIAAQLAAQMNAVISVPGQVEVASRDNAVMIGQAGYYIKDVSHTDGGDGSAMTVAEQIVLSTDKLTRTHYPGKIMQVQPDRGSASYYVKAVSESTGADDGDIQTVRWVEAARTKQAPIELPFVILAYKAGALNVAAGKTAAELRAITGDATIDLPAWGSRIVGDSETSPSPKFVNAQVTWMGMFQDRLCLATGAVVNMSEVGNYFNFYRTATLTVPDRDPVEIYALGSDNDTIRHSVLFDRSLVLFGDLQQYSIDGRNPVTPASTTVIQSGAIEDTTDAPPVAGGNLVFFGKRRENSTEVFQMEIGNVQDTSNYSGLGLQLSDYIPGKPAQLVYVASPGVLFVRTDAAPHSLFVFRFIDQGNQRLLDSWSRFDYHPAFGIIYSMFYHDDALYMRCAREAWVDQLGTVWTGGRNDFGYDVLERQSMLPQVPSLPYLDSMRAAGNVEATGTGYGVDWYGKNYPFLATALTKQRVAGSSTSSGEGWLHGVTPNVKTLAEFNSEFNDIPSRDINYAVTGLPFTSYVELTSPMRRDQNKQPIMQGRLTVARLTVYYRESSGLRASMRTLDKTDDVLNYNARRLGTLTNKVGIVPVVAGNVDITVGREAREYSLRISAQDWKPLSITRISWTGQWFMNYRFV